MLDRNTSVLLAYLCSMPRYRGALRMVWRVASGHPQICDIIGRVVVVDEPLAANGGA